MAVYFQAAVDSGPAKHPARCKQCDMNFQTLTEAQNHWRSQKHIEKAKQAAASAKISGEKSDENRAKV